jgi:hypothetical protein
VEERNVSICSKPFEVSVTLCVADELVNVVALWFFLYLSFVL